MEAQPVPESLILPPLYGWKVAHFANLIGSEELILAPNILFEPSGLQTRMQILGANGPIQLSIPVRKPEKSALLSQIQIDYNQKWQNQHWRSLTSAYGKSPYFSFFEPELKSLFQQQPVYLAEFTGAFSIWLLQQYRKQLRKPPAKLAPFSFKDQETSAYLSDLGFSEQDPSPITYQQVFGKEFVNFMGVLDHLFCAGPRFWNFQN